MRVNPQMKFGDTRIKKDADVFATLSRSGIKNCATLGQAERTSAGHSALEKIKSFRINTFLYETLGMPEKLTFR